MDERAPAWMLCDDMITRLKDELILEAIDILHEELKAGRIDISGYVSLLPEKSDEMQKDMYIIGNLVQREDEITEQYRPFIEGLESERNPAKVARSEELRKFMLSVHAISTLMRFSGVARAWAQATGRYSKYGEQIEILSKSMNEDDARCEVADFVLSSSRFAKSEALSDVEIAMLRQARSSTS